MPAADDWLSTKTASPAPRKSYLVASDVVGVIMDVAWFEGPRIGGGLWWIMANAEFPSGAITHFAPLNGPATSVVGLTGKAV